MGKKTGEKTLRSAEQIVDEVLVDEFLVEMDELLHKYPQDPNMTILNEEKLGQLIADLDKNWMSFKRRWQNRLPLDNVVGSGKVQKGEKGIRHLVIRSEVAPEPLIDLVVPDEDSPAV